MRENAVFNLQQHSPAFIHVYFTLSYILHIQNEAFCSWKSRDPYLKGNL